MENTKYENNYIWESFCKVGKTTIKTVENEQFTTEPDAEKGSLEAVVIF